MKKQAYLHETRQIYHPDVCPGDFYAVKPIVKQDDMEFEGNFICVRCNAVLKEYKNIVDHYVNKHAQEDWEWHNSKVQERNRNHKLKPWTNFHISLIEFYDDGCVAFVVSAEDPMAEEVVHDNVEVVSIAANIKRDNIPVKLESGFVDHPNPDLIEIRRTNESYSIRFVINKSSLP